MLSIFNYLDPGLFLKDKWREKKNQNPSFSLRAWAKRLGMKSNAPLSLMLQGKRTIPKKYIPSLISTFEMTQKEGLFLETLIDLKREKKLSNKEFYYNRLKSLAPSSTVSMYEVDSFKFFSDPIHTILLEMTCLKNFKNDAQWILDHLNFKATRERIESAINTLIKLRLLVETVDNSLLKTQKHLTNKFDVYDEGSVNFHKNISELASKLISKSNILEREYNSYSLNIKKSDLPLAKKLIREFSDYFIDKIEAPENQGEETYQLNLQFFSVTKQQG